VITPDWDAFAGVIKALDDVGVPYMVVGSVAASYHGLSRATHDVDLVVALDPDSVPALLSALKAGYYVDEESAYVAAREFDTFNAIHNEGVYKVDFWVLKPDEFSRIQFERRVLVDVDSVPVYLSSAEDIVLSKLLWNRATPSERQQADIRAVIEVKGGALDWNYINSWASKLGVADVLNRLIGEN